MSWITFVWPMVAGACLTLAAMHALVWMKDRRAWANLAFAGLALSVVAIVGFELALMHVQATRQFTALRSWLLVPVFVAIVCVLIFVRLHFQAGRVWLAHAAWIVRLAGVVFNFARPPQLFYREIRGLRQVDFFGASITVADGVPSSWLWLSQLSVLLLLTFVADASLTLWRRGGSIERRRALVIGGSLSLFILAAGVLMALVSWQVIAAPFLVSPFFLLMVAAMGFELSRDVLRAAQLADDLRESEQRMELAADAAQLGLWAWDVRQDRIWATAKCREMFGFGPTDSLALDRFLSALHAEDRDAVRRSVSAAAAGDGDYEQEYRVVLPDGAVRWIAARGQAEFNGGRQAVRLRGISIDITARKQTEEEIQRHRRELAHVSRVSIMGELSASMAHELNQPLTAILTNAHVGQRLVAANKPDVEEFREILADIVFDTTRARDVIRHLRALVKKSERVFTEFDLGDAIDEVVGFLHGDIVARNVQVALELAPDLPAIRGDRIQLQQVMINLLLNAFEAMSGNPVAERVATISMVQDSPGIIRVTVRDQGPGISADKIEAVFEPFFTTKREGMGMGLSVTRSIIESHDGRIWAENLQPQGAAFHFTLPVDNKTHA